MNSVIVLGASENRSKFGNKALRAFQLRGFEVFPVNPHAAQIEGLTTYPSVALVPKRPQVISVYLPPEVLQPLLPEIAAKGCDELWLNPGTDAEEVIWQAQQLGLKVVQGCGILRLGLSPASLAE